MKIILVISFILISVANAANSELEKSAVINEMMYKTGCFYAYAEFYKRIEKNHSKNSAQIIAQCEKDLISLETSQLTVAYGCVSSVAKGHKEFFSSDPEQLHKFLKAICNSQDIKKYINSLQF